MKRLNNRLRGLAMFRNSMLSLVGLANTIQPKRKSSLVQLVITCLTDKNKALVIKEVKL